MSGHARCRMCWEASMTDLSEESMEVGLLAVDGRSKGGMIGQDLATGTDTWGKTKEALPWQEARLWAPSECEASRVSPRREKERLFLTKLLPVLAPLVTLKILLLTDNNPNVFSAGAKSNFRVIILKISYKQKSIDVFLPLGKLP